MKRLIRISATVICIVICNASIFAQPQKITLSHSGVSTFHSNITAALTAANAGDTIYLPGGPVVASGSILVDKKLTIIGAGHYPDSTLATNPTMLPDIYFVSGADGGSLIGCRCSQILFGTDGTNETVNNFTIRRCRILNIIFTSYWGIFNSQNLLISENILDYHSSNIGSYAGSGILFEKNIINSNFGYGGPATFRNNVIYTNGSYPAEQLFYDNVFIAQGQQYLGANGIYNNNLFCTTDPAQLPAIFCGTNSVCNNNIAGLLASDTFIDADTSVFLYSANYHLNPTSPGHNAGTDGTDVGIFGTLYPYKDGALPPNPHIGYKNIGSQSNPAGTLPVDIKVSAQER